MNSRNKGARAELELAKYLQEHGYPEARRGQQFKGGVDSPDVAGFDKRFHIEVKRVEERSAGTIYEWFAQAEKDANGKKIPVVMHRKNRKPWVAILLLDDFLELVK